jgi:hypothetical protein
MRRSIGAFTALGVFFLIPVIVASAEVINFDTQRGMAGFNLLDQNNSGIRADYVVSEIALEDIEIDGQILRNIFISGVFLPNNAGAPNLPGEGRMIAIPQGAAAEFTIIVSQTEIIDNIDIAPAPPIPFETDNSPPVYEKDPAIYNQNEFYPAAPVLLSEPSKIRGVDYEDS